MKTLCMKIKVPQKTGCISCLLKTQVCVTCQQTHLTWESTCYISLTRCCCSHCLYRNMQSYCKDVCKPFNLPRALFPDSMTLQVYVLVVHYDHRPCYSWRVGLYDWREAECNVMLQVKMEQDLAMREAEEEAMRHFQFKANPLPKSTTEPRWGSQSLACSRSRHTPMTHFQRQTL